MEWTLVLTAVVVVIAFFALKQMRMVSADKARQLLRSGARVIDVRTPGEFSSGHVRGAINVPLDRLKTEIGGHVPDKTKPLLVHCLSGGRSEIAKVQLRRAGYQEVHNLGSLGRARKIVEGS